jgi:glutamine amidotransferase
VTPVAVVDYGAGNVRSVMKALAFVGAAPVRAASPDALKGAVAIVVPGVGHFGATGLLDVPWRAAILESIDAGVPLLGICLGMQWLFEGSDEAPGNPGLGLLAGRSIRIGRGVKVPHVGWNRLHQRGRCSRLLDGVSPGATMYFSHSYAVPPPADTVATTTHGQAFASVVERGAIFGVQGHPEKSGRVGLRLLGNFVGIAQAGGRC